MKPGNPVSFEVRGSELVIKREVDPEKFVEEFCPVFPRKLKKKIDLKKLYGQRLEEKYGVKYWNPSKKEEFKDRRTFENDIKGGVKNE